MDEHEDMKRNPQFIVYTGAMYSGKTSAMLALLDRYRHQSKRIVLFKPQLDERYSKTEVVTHMGWKIPATVIETGPDMFGYLNGLEEMPHVVAVDELFMLKGGGKALVWLFRQGLDVVVSSLDMSSACKPFPEMSVILPWATRIEKCAAVCDVCGRDAHYTYRTSDDTDEIVVGGKECYSPRCFEHHPLACNNEE